jgi:hypothetical protein
MLVPRSRGEFDFADLRQLAGPGQALEIGFTPDSRKAIERSGLETVSAIGVHSPQTCGAAGTIRLLFVE